MAHVSSPPSLLRSRVLRTLSLGALCGAAACAEGPAPGSYYDLTLTTQEDACNAQPVTASEQYTYRLERDGAAVSVFLDDAFLASGSLSGCDLTYDSPVWSEQRSSGVVRWSVRGKALVSFGDGCNAGQGWVGTEEVNVLSSTDPDTPSGCRYTYDVAGRFIEEVE